MKVLAVRAMMGTWLLVLAACATPGEPKPAETPAAVTVAVVVPAPRPTSSAPPASSRVVAEEQSPGEWGAVEDAVAFIDAKVSGCCPPMKFSLRLENGGRFVKAEASDAYEEDFFLRDATRVEYAEEPSWDYRHVARVVLKKDAVCRFRRGTDPWETSTILTVSFPFTERSDADEVIRAWEYILSRRPP